MVSPSRELERAPCPLCGSDAGSRVTDSQPCVAHGGIIRRRRVCLACRQRFTTYELPDDALTRIARAAKRHDELLRWLRESEDSPA